MSVVTQVPLNPAIAPNATQVPGPIAVTAFRTALNTYVSSVEDKVQLAQAFIEGLASLIGNGVVSGGLISAGAGLSVSVSALVALVGNRVETDAATTVGGLANGASGGSTNRIWLRQDGSFTVNQSGSAPSTGDGHGLAILLGTADTAAGAVTGVTNVGGSGPLGYRQTFDGWYQDNVAASQSGVALPRQATPTFGDKLILPRAGSITGICVKCSAPRSAGTLTVQATKNGSAFGPTAVLDGSNTTFKATTATRDTYSFVAGDELGMIITTDGSWAPTTGDIRASLETST